LLKYKLNTEQELFDKAYGYIRQYYRGEGPKGIVSRWKVGSSGWLRSLGE